MKNWKTLTLDKANVETEKLSDANLLLKLVKRGMEIHKKQHFHNKKLESFKHAYEGKGRKITLKELEELEESLGE